MLCSLLLPLIHLNSLGSHMALLFWETATTARPFFSGGPPLVPGPSSLGDRHKCRAQLQLFAFDRTYTLLHGHVALLTGRYHTPCTWPNFWYCLTLVCINHWYTAIHVCTMSLSVCYLCYRHGFAALLSAEVEAVHLLRLWYTWSPLRCAFVLVMAQPL